MKHLVVRGLLLLLLITLAAGCGETPLPTPPPTRSPFPPTPPPTDMPPAVTLTVWHSWDEGEEVIFRELLAAYQNDRPGITVRLRRVPVERILGEYEEAVRAGEGPDLLAGRSHWIGRLAEGKVIAPLDDLLDEETRTRFAPFVWEGVRDDGAVYALPYACETVALYYNRDFVSEPPTTTTALLALAANWQGEEQAGLAFPMSFYNTVGYLYAFGGRLLDEEGHAALDSVEARAWLAWLQEVRTAPGVIATDHYGQADSLFQQGAVGMVINGSWALPDYVRALGVERLGVARLPMLDQTLAWPTPFVGYRVLLVNPARLPLHPAETLDLLHFLTGPAPQQALAGQEWMLPTSAELDLSANALLAAFFRQVEAGRPRPVTPQMDLIWDPTENLLDNVLSGRVPIDLALQETQQQVEQALLEMDETTPASPW